MGEIPVKEGCRRMGDTKQNRREEMNRKKAMSRCRCKARKKPRF
jgi:hypothetical protein